MDLTLFLIILLVAAALLFVLAAAGVRAPFHLGWAALAIVVIAAIFERTPS